MKYLNTFESFLNEAASIPSNIMSFAKRKGPSAVALVKKAAGWAEKAGKYISGGTAIGKNYSTILLATTIFVLASCGTSKAHCDAYGDISNDTNDLAYENN